MLVYDCSGSLSYGRTGPKENDIVRYLKKYSHLYGVKFVSSWNDADVIFTNDVFDRSYPGKRKVKRMDGIYWKNSLKERNSKYNAAAIEADEVIFISKYSMKCYFEMYGDPLQSYRVVSNWVDDLEYFNEFTQKKYEFVASASDWSREEKRLQAVLDFVKKSGKNLLLIGKCDYDIGHDKTGYLDSPEEIRKALNLGVVFLNFSYRDAITKTVAQALCCGLPVAYAGSGGVGELVEHNGWELEDHEASWFEDNVPALEIPQSFVDSAWYKHVSGIEGKFTKMLDGYFRAIMGREAFFEVQGF